MLIFFFFFFRETICCGTIFKGPNGEILVDTRFLKPCNARLQQLCKLGVNENVKPELEISEASISKGYSDSSSDSGYDESSNQGAIFNYNLKKENEEESCAESKQAN